MVKSEIARIDDIEWANDKVIWHTIIEELIDDVMVVTMDHREDITEHRGNK